MRSRLLVLAIAAALSHAPAARAAPPDDPKALLVQGHDLELKGEWGKAREVYARLANAKGYAGRAVYLEAWAAFQAGELDDALALAMKAAQLTGPQQQDAKFLYGDALYRLGEYARARDIYGVLTKSAATGDARRIAEKKLAAANLKLGQPPGSAPPAPPAPAPAAPARPPRADAAGDALYKQATDAFGNGDLDTAMQLAMKAAEQSGAHKIDAKFLYGDVLFRRGELQRAKDVYVALRKLTTGDLRAMATRKIAATNTGLKLPESDGITD